MTIKKEEYTPLADFIKASFTRDQQAIMQRYPKMNEAFLAAFSARLEQVKKLESGAQAIDSLKKATKSLYEEAAALNRELTFLSDYFEAAGLDTTLIGRLKKDLRTYNIEGAVLKIETVRQLAAANGPALTAEGMPPAFAETLATHKESLQQKNSEQNSHLDTGKDITQTNTAAYEALYDYISEIADKGKKVFQGSVTRDQYSIRHIIQRMRAESRDKE